MSQYAQWRVDSRKWRGQLQITPTFSPWTSRTEFRGQGLPQCERVLDLLDLVVAQKISDLQLSGRMSFKALQEKLADVYVDVSQGHVRRPFTPQKGPSHCLTTSSAVYSFARDAMVLPLEMLMWHGHKSSVTLPPNMSQKSLAKLAGEGMALPSLGTVIWALFLLKQFPESSSQ